MCSTNFQKNWSVNSTDQCYLLSFKDFITRLLRKVSSKRMTAGSLQIVTLRSHNWSLKELLCSMIGLKKGQGGEKLAGGYIFNRNWSFIFFKLKLNRGYIVNRSWLFTSFHFRIKIENLRKFLNRRKMQRIGKALVAISAFKEAARCRRCQKLDTWKCQDLPQLCVLAGFDVCFLLQDIIREH